MSEGKKRIEPRLFDDKRRAIIRGDPILFAYPESGEQMTDEVLKLQAFSSFDELYENLPLDKCGYEKTDMLIPQIWITFMRKKNKRNMVFLVLRSNW